MLNSSIVLYFGSRTLSAAGNLLSVVIFTRLVDPVEYGHYLLIYAWATIVFGFSTQWIGYAYFGVYETKRIDEYVNSFARLIASALVVIVTGFALMAWLGFWQPEFLFAVCVLVICISIYSNALQISRTKLNFRGGAISMIIRTCTTIVLGSIVLWQGGGATGLAFVVAFANLIATIPCLMSTGKINLALGSRTTSFHILNYGWPLMLSFGVQSLGLYADRLLVGQFIGVAALGTYGVLYDFLRQGFSVMGEVITFSMVTDAKQHIHEGNTKASTDALRAAFNASFATAALGAAFLIVFGEQIARVLLGSRFHGEESNLIPIFAIAFGILLMGQSYFNQTIYFSKASFLEPILQTALVSVSVAVSIWLIPIYGLQGAAIAVLAAGTVYCVGFIVLGRHYFRMPVDYLGLAVISTFAVLFVFGSWTLAHVVTETAILQASKVAVFMVLCALVVYQFGLLRHTPTGMT
ncbi:MAG TPA: lipopolysaccharide biosynthesis protein [Steroidobacteraceae bacterium]|nr:lipopolysaccharide biosynthesis protein [Steroidobacteraceae bacterium]